MISRRHILKQMPCSLYGLKRSQCEAYSTACGNSGCHIRCVLWAVVACHTLTFLDLFICLDKWSGDGSCIFFSPLVWNNPACWLCTQLVDFFLWCLLTMQSIFSKFAVRTWKANICYRILWQTIVTLTYFSLLKWNELEWNKIKQIYKTNKRYKTTF